MSSIKKIVFYVIVFIVSIVMTILKINIFIIFAIGFMLLFLMILPYLYTVFWEKDINKIEKFLIKEKGNPIYQLFYALANKLDEEVKDAIDQLLKKHKARHKQALYKVIYALYCKDILAAKQEVDNIKSDNFKYYYKSAVLMEEGNLNEARQLIEHISIPWMKSALLSELEYKLNDLDKAMYFAKHALDNAKGLQKYILYKTYEREFPTM